MKMILSSLNLVSKIGVCIASEENGESKLTSEEIVICTTSYESHTYFSSRICRLINEGRSPELIKQISEKRDFHNVLYTLFFCISKKLEKFSLKGL
jgi:hypothetical protein